MHSSKYFNEFFGDAMKMFSPRQICGHQHIRIGGVAARAVVAFVLNGVLLVESWAGLLRDDA